MPLMLGLSFVGIGLAASIYVIVASHIYALMPRRQTKTAK